MSKILVEWRDHYGWNPILTPYAADVSRTWVWNEIGTASFTLPLTTPLLWSIIAWGRIIRILEDGVTPWIGVVEEREWSESGVTLQLKSAEYLLNKKLTGQGLAFPAGTAAGTIAHGIFVSAYLHSSIVHPLRVGLFDASRARFVEPYNYADCWDELKKLADESGAAVWVDADLAVHFRNERGTDKWTTVKLREGKHLVNVRIRETIGEALTHAVALGPGSELVNRLKIATSLNADLGYVRAEVLTFDGASDPNELLQLTKQEIGKRAFPKLTVDAELVKAEAGEFWQAFWIGDIVELILTSYLNPNTGAFGLNQRARVTGVELAGEDRMRLVLEIIERDNSDVPLIAWQPSL